MYRTLNSLPAITVFALALQVLAPAAPSQAQSYPFASGWGYTQPQQPTNTGTLWNSRKIDPIEWASSFFPMAVNPQTRSTVIVPQRCRTIGGDNVIVECDFPTLTHIPQNVDRRFVEDFKEHMEQALPLPNGYSVWQTKPDGQNPSVCLKAAYPSARLPSFCLKFNTRNTSTTQPPPPPPPPMNALGQSRTSGTRSLGGTGTYETVSWLSSFFTQATNPYTKSTAMAPLNCRSAGSVVTECDFPSNAMQSLPRVDAHFVEEIKNQLSSTMRSPPGYSVFYTKSDVAQSSLCLQSSAPSYDHRSLCVKFNTGNSRNFGSSQPFALNGSIQRSQDSSMQTVPNRWMGTDSNGDSNIRSSRATASPSAWIDNIFHLAASGSQSYSHMKECSRNARGIFCRFPRATSANFVADSNWVDAEYRRMQNKPMPRGYASWLGMPPLFGNGASLCLVAAMTGQDRSVCVVFPPPPASYAAGISPSSTGTLSMDAYSAADSYDQDADDMSPQSTAGSDDQDADDMSPHSTADSRAVKSVQNAIGAKPSAPTSLWGPTSYSKPADWVVNFFQAAIGKRPGYSSPEHCTNVSNTLTCLFPGKHWGMNHVNQGFRSNSQRAVATSLTKMGARYTVAEGSRSGSFWTVCATPQTEQAGAPKICLNMAK